MAKVLKIFKTLRNHWKKSTFASASLVYGVNYGREKYEIESLMRDYCKVAEIYGDAPLPTSVKPRHLTVILNPAASRRKAKSMFEKYCAPLLYLAGFCVTIIQTESEGQARLLVKDLKDTDAIIVAGGDGTVSETVTGLMRENNGKCNVPIGVLPLGRTNSIALSLLGGESEPAVSPKTMAEAALNIIRWNMKDVDTLKIDVLQEEGVSAKPVYAVGGIKWGPYRDAYSKQDKYWYFDGLRGYAAYLFAGDRTDKVAAHVTYTPPCTGCSKCYQFRSDLQIPEPKYRWWHYIIPSLGKKQAIKKIDYTKIQNDKCGISCEKEINTVDFNLTTPNIRPNTEGIQVDLGPQDVSYTDFIKDGWQRVKGKATDSIVDTFSAQQLEIHPKMVKSEKEKCLSIDNEEYEVRPVRITLVPKSVRMFIAPS